MSRFVERTVEAGTVETNVTTDVLPATVDVRVIYYDQRMDTD